MISQRDHVVDLVDYAPAGATGRPPVSRTIVRDDEDAEPTIEVLVRPSLKAAAGCSVQEEDREAVGIAPQRERKLASIRSLQRQKRLAHGRAEHTPVSQLDGSVAPQRLARSGGIPEH